MSAALQENAVANTNLAAADDIATMSTWRWEELFALPDAERKAFQKSAATRRFRELAPKIKALQAQADSAGIADVTKVEDLPGLLFNHTSYKSYPMMVLEKGRYDMLTKWLQTMTSVDLSGVDASKCNSIDSWLTELEAKTSLRPYHTSGTTGKLSFLPRTTLELELYNKIFLKMLEKYSGNKTDPLGGNGVRVPVIYPSLRHGRMVAQRLLDYLQDNLAPTPGDVHVMSQGRISADVLSLSGRVRVAQSKGELAKMNLPDSQKQALANYLAELGRRPQETEDFFQRITKQLHGERVLIFSQTSYLVQAARAAEARGGNTEKLFASNSYAAFGGGGKDVVLPDGYENLIRDFTGLQSWAKSYAMSEVTGTMPMCDEGHYHVPPYFIPFVLDPETGEAAPQHGVRTGRFACMDLVPQTYWGGIITGDKVTVDYDGNCKCGRLGPFVHDNIGRFSEAVTGDDKVTCSATIDNTDAALQQLLAAE